MTAKTVIKNQTLAVAESLTPFEVGQLVFSIGGRDHGRYYLVYRIDAYAKRVLLVDGDKRDITKPKCKNFCHLQKTNVVSEPFRAKVLSQSEITAAEIKNYLVQLTIDQ